jgi:PhzF family phenazine biosynthesis protein
MLKDFVQVDAFSDRPLYGNPAAVVFDADDIPTATMQQIAKEMNLSETVFIVAPTHARADYRARIFTPMNELPFAGHPTIAASHAVLSRYRDKANATLLQQECTLGLIPVEVIARPAGRLLRMTQAAPQYRDPGLARDTVARMLGCAEADLAPTPIEIVSTGVPWLVAQLARLPTISALAPDLGLIAKHCAAIGAPGITVFVERGEADGDARVRLRTFAPGEGVNEDPVCGSGNGSVAAFIAQHKHPDAAEGAYIAEQGIEIRRDGIVHASWRRENGRLRIMIGGAAVTVMSGQIHL